MPSLWKTWFGNVYFGPSGKWRGNVYFSDPLENTVMVMSTLPSSSPRRLGRFGRRESRKIVYAGSVRFPQGIENLRIGLLWGPRGSLLGRVGALSALVGAILARLGALEGCLGRTGARPWAT